MLSDKEERKMHSEIPDAFSGNQRYFMNETTLSKKEQNYALSLCARKTFYCMRSLDNRKLFIRYIIEPRKTRKAGVWDFEYYSDISSDSELDLIPIERNGAYDAVYESSDCN